MGTNSILKVLHIIPSLGKGGAERMLLDIVRELKKRDDVEVKLVTLSPVNDYCNEYPDINPVVINSKVIPSILGKWKVDITELESIINDYRPNVINSHLFIAEIVSRYKIAKSIKYFTHCQDNMSQLNNFKLNTLFSKRKLTNYYERIFIIKNYLKCNNNFIAISNDTIKYFYKTIPQQLHKNIYLLPNVINNSIFNKVAGHPRDFTKISMINVASFQAKKNQQFLIDVARIILDKGYNVELKLIGDGALRKVVEDKAEYKGIKDKVIFYGNVYNVENYLKDANIYVHSAYYEPFGIVIIEAMASGLPVVCLDGKGNRDIIKEGETGYMIFENDPELFANRVIEIYSDKNKYSKMSENAQKFASTYDIKNYVDSLLDLYRN